MRNELSVIGENRLKQVLVLDKQINNSIINVIKSDVLYALKNYMEITASDLDFSISINDYGFYEVVFCAKVRRLITFSSLKE